MDYYGVLRHSFEITRRHRSLWLFGFLVALLGAGGSAGNGLRFVFRGGEAPPPPAIGRTELLFIVAILGLVALVLTVVTVVVNYVAQTALIGMVGEIETGASPNVRRGFQIGWSRQALRLFGADLVVFAPVTAIVFLAIFVPIFFLAIQAGQQGASSATPLLLLCCLFLFVLLLIPVSIVLNVLRTFYYRRIVLAEDGVLDGIRNAWQVIRANVGPVATIWLIMLLIGLLWAAVNLVLVLGAFALVGIPAAAIHALARSWVLAAISVLPLVMLAMIALAAINALYTVFSSTVWTLTYLALPQAPVTSSPTAGEVM